MRTTESEDMAMSPFPNGTPPTSTNEILLDAMQHRMPARPRLFDLIRAELDRAYDKHGREPWGRHEFFGILKEEVDELWDDIKADAPQEQLLKELVQVAAMCFRYFETGDKYRGSHPTL